MKKIIIWSAVIILACIPVLVPLLREGFFITDDADWLMIRFSAFYQAFSDGQFPVRWLGRLNNGYGYPVANFAYPGFMYAVVPLHVFFDLIISIKLFIAATIIASGLFCYFWLREHVNDFSAVSGSIIYVYAPYHIYDLYTRGSLGELYALAIVPFVLWHIARGRLLLTALGTALLILSHNTLAVLFLPVLIGYAIVMQSRIFIMYFLSGGLAISAFFWLPALSELSYTRFSQTTISDWSRYFAEWTLFGLTILTGIILLCIHFIRSGKVAWSMYQNRLVLFFLSIALVSVFFSSAVSAGIWPYLPSSFIQFPFRLLSVYILSGAFIWAILLNRIKNRSMYVVGVAIIMFAFLEVIPQLSYVRYVERIDGYYTTNMSTTTIKDEYMPIAVKVVPNSYPVDFVQADNASLSEVYKTNDTIQFRSESTENSTAMIHAVFFPGWRATIDGNHVPIRVVERSGLMEVIIPEGAHVVEFTFGRTMIRLVSEIISIIGIIGLLAYALIQKSDYSK